MDSTQNIMKLPQSDWSRQQMLNYHWSIRFCKDLHFSNHVPSPTPERPIWTTWSPLGTLRVWQGQSGASRGSSKPLWCCEDHFRVVWMWTCLFLSPILFSNISAPWNCIEMVLYSELTYGSELSQEKKTVYKSVSLLQRYSTNAKGNFFSETSCSSDVLCS